MNSDTITSTLYQSDKREVIAAAVNFCMLESGIDYIDYGYNINSKIGKSSNNTISTISSIVRYFHHV